MSEAIYGYIPRDPNPFAHQLMHNGKEHVYYASFKQWHTRNGIPPQGMRQGDFWVDESTYPTPRYVLTIKRGKEYLQHEGHIPRDQFTGEIRKCLNE